MERDGFPKLQNEFNANLEILKVTKDPAKRRELLINLRRLLAAIEGLAQDNSVNGIGAKESRGFS